MFVRDNPTLKTVLLPVHHNFRNLENTVKLGNKERFDKEQIGIKESFPVTNLTFTSQG